MTKIPVVLDEEEPDKKVNVFKYEADYNGDLRGEATVALNYVDVGFEAPAEEEATSDAAATEATTDDAAVPEDAATEPEATDGAGRRLAGEAQQNVTWSLYFANNDATNCGFDKCELMGLGCQWPYTGTDNLKMAAAAPWTIQAKTSVPEGYNTTYCIKCSNGWNQITQDNIVFTQHPQTNWVLILIIILVVVIVLACAAIFLAAREAPAPAPAAKKDDVEMTQPDTGRDLVAEPAAADQKQIDDMQSADGDQSIDEERK